MSLSSLTPSIPLTQNLLAAFSKILSPVYTSCYSFGLSYEQARTWRKQLGFAWINQLRVPHILLLLWIIVRFRDHFCSRVVKKSTVVELVEEKRARGMLSSFMFFSVKGLSAFLRLGSDFGKLLLPWRHLNRLVLGHRLSDCPILLFQLGLIERSVG
jgi:hypothetical protein